MDGISKDHFTKLFAKQKIVSASAFGVSLNIDFSDIGKRLDHAQQVLDDQVWTDMQQYMPEDTGLLKQQTNTLNQSVHGLVYAFHPDSDYGHYQWEGTVYVDPVYGKGAFFSPEYGFWSRKEVTKIPSDRKLNYSQPSAQSHWDEVAIKNHRKQWIDLVQKTVERG